MTKYYKTSLSNFYCTLCGKKGIDIPRKKGQEREPGHLKNLYCIYCRTNTNHAEVREIGGYTYEDFLEEFKLGRFIDGNKTAIDSLINCSNEGCPYNKNGKCWNANNSVNCQYKGVDLK